MCNGCWFGEPIKNGGVEKCGGSATKAYARAPSSSGEPQGDTKAPTGTAEEKSISKTHARVSVAYCAEQMKDATECSKEYIGVAGSNGHCWCVKAGEGECTGGNWKKQLMNVTHGGFFKCKLETHSLVYLFIH